MTNETTNPGHDPGPADTQAASESQTQKPENNGPADVLRDGNIKATIWKNERENGPSFSTVFARTWQDEEGGYRDSHSFSGTEMLRVSELARGAYTRTIELRQEHRVEITREETRSTSKDDPELPYDERSDLAAFKAKREAESQEQPRSKSVSRRK
jgi:hypothetical protein